MCLRDPPNRYIFFLETLIILTVEEVLDDVGIRNKLTTILHPLYHVQVLEKSCKAREEQRICEFFPRMSMAVLACFFAVQAMRLCFMWTNIADAGVYTAIISHWVIGGKELDPCFCDFERRYIVAVVSKHDLGPGFL